MIRLKDFDNEEVEEFIQEYGYGNCHLLSQFIAKKYNLDIGVVKLNKSGILIHSFVFLNDQSTFDAHGINNPEEIERNYQKAMRSHDESNLTIERLPTHEGVDFLSIWAYADDDDLEFMSSEFKRLDKLTSIKEKLESLIYNL